VSPQNVERYVDKRNKLEIRWKKAVCAYRYDLGICLWGMRHSTNLQFVVTNSKCQVTIVFRRSQEMSVGVMIRPQAARQKNLGSIPRRFKGFLSSPKAHTGNVTSQYPI
jgi:hypothetical protein